MPKSKTQTGQPLSTTEQERITKNYGLPSREIGILITQMHKYAHKNFTEIRTVFLSSYPLLNIPSKGYFTKKNIPLILARLSMGCSGEKPCFCI